MKIIILEFTFLIASTVIADVGPFNRLLAFAVCVTCYRACVAIGSTERTKKKVMQIIKKAKNET